MEDLYYKYHQKRGYSIDRCWKLRHDIQDLFEKGIITPLPTQPNVSKNPFSNHQGTLRKDVNHIEIRDVLYKLIKCITQLSQPTVSV